MCSYPAPIQGLFLAFAALGVLSLGTTLVLLWGVRSGERARKSPRLVRYTPEPVAAAPFRDQVSGPLKMVKHDDLFRDPEPEPETKVLQHSYWRPMTERQIEDHQATKAFVNDFLDRMPPQE